MRHGALKAAIAVGAALSVRRRKGGWWWRGEEGERNRSGVGGVGGW